MSSKASSTGHHYGPPRHRRGRWSASPLSTTASHSSPAAPGRWSAGAAGTDPDRGEPASRRANKTGVDRTTRKLRGVMGLWLLKKSMRAWRTHGWRSTSAPSSKNPLCPDCAPSSTYDPALLAPSDMPIGIAVTAVRAHLCGRAELIKTPHVRTTTRPARSNDHRQRNSGGWRVARDPRGRRQSQR
jgi:hypothetical protein